MQPRAATVHSLWVRHLIQALESDGLDSTKLAQRAGLSPAMLEDVDGRISGGIVNRLFELAAQDLGDKPVGIIKDLRMPSRPFGVVAYAMASSMDLFSLMKCLMRYARIVSDALIWRQQQRNGACAFILDSTVIEDPLSAQRHCYGFYTLLSFCRWLATGEVSPASIELTADSLPARESYEQAFGCPIVLGAKVNAMVFSKRTLALELPAGNRQLSELHGQVADAMLERLDIAPIVARTRQAIILELKTGTISRRRVAHRLAMSERSLSRRLEEEDTTYQELLEETRREIASRYIRQRQVSLTEIAYMLGFSDCRSLFRVWKRWYGDTPRARAN